MKVGIITFHCSYNFGSALQAVALKYLLNKLGHQSKVIDYRGRDFEKYLLLPTYSKRALLDSVFHFPENKRRAVAFESFMRDHMDLTRRFTWRNEYELDELQSDFDCFVCGSDQIWNLDCTDGPIGPYFLSFAGDRGRIAYAPSIAHTHFRDGVFGPAQKKEVAGWLSRFDAISVREAATVCMFQPLVDSPISVCLDPTLMLDRSDYAPMLEGAKDIGDPSGSLFVYMLEHNDALVSYADRIAQELCCGIQYVSGQRLPFRSPSRNLYGVGPSEFLALVARSRAVVTNSFHATVFSLLFDRPFHTLATRESGSRMVELLGNLGLSSHLTDGSGHLDVTEPGEDRVARGLAPLRESSLAFLEDALGEA